MALLLAGTRDYHVAEDLLQEVWVRLAQCLEAGASIADEARWCRATAKHLLLHHWRSERRAVIGACADFEAVLERIEQSLVESEAFAGEACAPRQEALQECLAHLPPRKRTLLELRYEARRRIEKIAEELRETPEAVAKALTCLPQWDAAGRSPQTLPAAKFAAPEAARFSPNATRTVECSRRGKILAASVGARREHSVALVLHPHVPLPLLAPESAATLLLAPASDCAETTGHQGAARRLRHDRKGKLAE